MIIGSRSVPVNNETLESTCFDSFSFMLYINDTNMEFTII